MDDIEVLYRAVGILEKVGIEVVEVFEVLDLAISKLESESAYVARLGKLISESVKPGETPRDLAEKLVQAGVKFDG